MSVHSKIQPNISYGEVTAPASTQIHCFVNLYVTVITWSQLVFFFPLTILSFEDLKDFSYSIRRFFILVNLVVYCSFSQMDPFHRDHVLSTRAMSWTGFGAKLPEPSISSLLLVCPSSVKSIHMQHECSWSKNMLLVPKWWIWPYTWESDLGFHRESQWKVRIRKKHISA